MVGMFDSGVGGLSVWREVVALLPGQNIMYVSDNAYCPYGSRPAEEVIERTKKISEYLIRQSCSLIVVACNTATAAAIDALRAAFPVPFVGMEPAVKPAALHSRTGVVGILATRGTFKGRLYQETLHRFASQIRVVEQTGDGLVELVEQGLADSPQALRLLRQYIAPMIEAGADHLVLGCTHYPFLIPAIQKITGPRVAILNPAPAVAKRVQFLLNEAHSSHMSTVSAHYKFFASGAVATMNMMLQDMGLAAKAKQLNLFS